MFVIIRDLKSNQWIKEYHYDPDTGQAFYQLVEKKELATILEFPDNKKEFKYLFERIEQCLKTVVLQVYKVEFNIKKI